MTKIATLFTLAGSLTVASLLPLLAQDKPPAKDPDKVAKYLTEPVLKILNHATRAQGYRVAAERAGKPAPLTIARYPITLSSAEQGRGFATRLAAVLRDEKNLFGKQTGRGFEPRFAFRLWSGKETVEVLIDFQRSTFQLRANDAEGKPISFGKDDDGQPIRYRFGYFGSDIRPLTRLLQEAFPDDKEIQQFPT